MLERSINNNLVFHKFESAKLENILSLYEIDVFLWATQLWIVWK